MGEGVSVWTGIHFAVQIVVEHLHFTLMYCPGLYDKITALLCYGISSGMMYQESGILTFELEFRI